MLVGCQLYDPPVKVDGGAADEASQPAVFKTQSTGQCAVKNNFHLKGLNWFKLVTSKMD